MKENALNLELLQRQVASMTLEKEKLKELIEELKQTNKIYLGEQELLEQKLQSR